MLNIIGADFSSVYGSHVLFVVLGTRPSVLAGGAALPFYGLGKILVIISLAANDTAWRSRVQLPRH
jgi:hypothetical protein